MPIDLHSVSQIFNPLAKYQTLENNEIEIAQDIFWRRVRMRLHEKKTAVGLAFNLISFEAQNFDVLAMHSNDENAPDETIQAAIANAYWQTVWAGDAVRRSQGEVYPVAFFPCRRCVPDEDETAACEIKALNDNQYLIGGESILTREILQAVADERVTFSQAGFSIDGNERLSNWLNRYAFADRFVGANRTNQGSGLIQKFITVANSHLISKTVTEMISRNFRGNPLSVAALCNAGYFLNFPEEYMNPFAAMNDPIGLIIQNGRILQLPLLSRGTILVDEQNRCKITDVSMSDISIKIPWQNRWLSRTEEEFFINDPTRSGEDIVIYTPSFLAEKPPQQQHTPRGDVIDLTIVFGRCVEMTIEGRSEIPESGFILSIPKSENAARILRHFKDAGNIFLFRLLNEKFGLKPIRTGLSAGPILLHSERQIADSFFESGYANEEFMAMMQNGAIRQKGIAPTRFPFDTSITRAPRSFLAIDKNDRLVCGIIDGRAVDHSAGACLREVAGFCHVLGYKSVLNLDGGGSSVLTLTDFSKAGAGLADHLARGIVNLPSDEGNSDRLMPVSIIIKK